MGSANISGKERDQARFVLWTTSCPVRLVKQKSEEFECVPKDAEHHAMLIGGARVSLGQTLQAVVYYLTIPAFTVVPL